MSSTLSAAPTDPVASVLYDLGADLTCDANARLVPSDRPGHICIEVTATAECFLTFEDTIVDSENSSGSDVYSDAYNEVRRLRHRVVRLVYFPMNGEIVLHAVPQNLSVGVDYDTPITMCRPTA